MGRILDGVIHALREPLDALFGAEKRLFLPFLASSAAIAALVWLARVRRHGKTGLFGYLFAPRVFLHRSALLDYQVIVARGVLSAVLFAPLFVSTIAVAVEVAYRLRMLFGVASPSSLSRGAVATLFTIAAFVADDLTRYVVHRAMHRVPALWELHKVHHSAEVLTPFTLHRVHPLEGVVNGVRASVTIGVVTGAFIWLFPGRVRGWEILGVDAIGFAFAALGANLRHSQVWLSYGPALERLVISPAQHQVHHSVEPRHHDRNFGAALAIWDWLFGSLYVTRAHEKLTFGLDAATQNHGASVLSTIVAPMVAAVRVMLPRKKRAAAVEPVPIE